MTLSELSRNKVLILDGAMGTMIQKYNLAEEDYRGIRFRNHSSLLKGNNDILCITKPEIIQDIHRQYFEAGADIVETNTFSGTTIAQQDYNLESIVYELNVKAAQIAKTAAIEYTRKTPGKPRFVAGAMGPTNRTASLSPDVNRPAFRAVYFDDLRKAYYEQAKGLMDGGVDILLVETVFDTLNAKAALFAIQELFTKTGKILPVMVSGTITDASGRTLSGQTTEAFLISVSHIPLLSIGLNCALGATQLRPYIQELSEKAPFLVSAYPNAGLPNAFGTYDQSPENMAEQLREYLEEGWVNFIGGCCGTTPDHIRAIAELAKQYRPRQLQQNDQKIYA